MTNTCTKTCTQSKMFGKLNLNRYKSWTGHACSLSSDHETKGGADSAGSAEVSSGLHPTPGMRGVLHEPAQPQHGCLLHHDLGLLENESPVWLRVYMGLFINQKTGDCSLFFISLFFSALLSIPTLRKLLPKLTLSLSSVSFTLFLTFPLLYFSFVFFCAVPSSDKSYQLHHCLLTDLYQGKRKPASPTASGVQHSVNRLLAFRKTPKPQSIERAWQSTPLVHWYPCPTHQEACSSRSKDSSRDSWGKVLYPVCPHWTHAAFS